MQHAQPSIQNIRSNFLVSLAARARLAGLLGLLVGVAMPVAKAADGMLPSNPENPNAALATPYGTAASPAASSAAATMPNKPMLPADTSLWALDADHSEIGFTVKHMMISNVRGSFHTVVGELQWHEKDITKSKLDVTLAVASIDTHVQKRDDHLRSPEFFDAMKFPNIVFKSTKIKKKGRDWLISGDLTIRDVTKTIVLNVKSPSKPFKDPFGLLRSGVSATGKISRKDFGLTWNKNLEAGGVLVDDTVNIEVSAEFIKKM